MTFGIGDVTEQVKLSAARQELRASKFIRVRLGMSTFRYALTVILTAYSTCLVARPSDLDKVRESQRQVLEMITSAAVTNICGNLQFEGSKLSASGEASLKFGLNSLLKRLVDAKVTAAGDAQYERFRGLRQVDLLPALSVMTECRSKLAVEILRTLVTSPPKGVRPQLATIHVAPSFDCKQARVGAERLICASQDLAVLDLALANTYRDALAVRQPRAARSAIRSMQHHWLRDIRNRCTNAACLEQTYQERMQTLRLHLP